MAESDAIPQALQHAHSELVAWLDKPVKDWEPESEICSRIERFVDAMRENSEWYEELVKRATLVQPLIGKGTQYDTARIKVVAPRLQISSMSTVDDVLWAMEQQPIDYVTAALESHFNDLCVPIGVPLVRSIRRQRSRIELLLNAPDGICAVRGNLERWLKTCLDIEAQVSKPYDNLQVDGCHLLVEISVARHAWAPKSANGWREMAMGASGKSIRTAFESFIPDVKGAADSMVDWVKRNSPTIGEPEQNQQSEAAKPTEAEKAETQGDPKATPLMFVERTSNAWELGWSLILELLDETLAKRAADDQKFVTLRTESAALKEKNAQPSQGDKVAELTKAREEFRRYYRHVELDCDGLPDAEKMEPWDCGCMSVRQTARAFGQLVGNVEVITYKDLRLGADVWRENVLRPMQQHAEEWRRRFEKLKRAARSKAPDKRKPATKAKLPSKFPPKEELVLAALIAHHKYESPQDDGYASVIATAAASYGTLQEMAGVGRATITSFFNRWFPKGGNDEYKRICKSGDAVKLSYELARIRGELPSINSLTLDPEA